MGHWWQCLPSNGLPLVWNFFVLPDLSKTGCIAIRLLFLYLYLCGCVSKALKWVSRQTSTDSAHQSSLEDVDVLISVLIASAGISSDPSALPFFNTMIAWFMSTFKDLGQKETISKSLLIRIEKFVCHLCAWICTAYGKIIHPGFGC